MFLKISESITSGMVKNGIIHSENRELYRYGIQQFFTILLNIAVTLVIGLLFSMIWESILFTAAYIPLRSFAGGYHAKTPLRCCIFSGIMIASVLSVMRFVIMANLIWGGLLLFSLISICILAPVEDKNKPLDNVEKRVYRQRTLLIMFLEIALIATLYVFRSYNIAICITMAIIVLNIMLVLGKMKNVYKMEN